MKRSFIKILAIVMIIGLNWTGLSAVWETFAYFSDTEVSQGNSYQAGTLDIDTSPDDLGSVGLDITQNYSVINQGSLPFEYSMTALISGGSDSTFCGQLNISVLKGTTLYAGSLSGLDFTKLIEGVQDDLTFTITDTNNNSAGKVCSFNLVSKAWQDTLDYSQGFTDIVYTKAVVYSAGTVLPPSTGGVVLNEFLPRPDGILCADGGSSCIPGDSNFIFDFGNDNSNMPKGEWVELYNNGDIDANVTGWYLADASNGKGNETLINNSHILVPLPIVPAHGWLVVYMNKPIYNNTGDTVRLFNASGTLVDSYSYGVDPTYCDMEPTPNDNNDTNPSGSCDSSNVPGNKSFARIPDGIGAWVDPIPTPGMANKLNEELVEEPAKELVEEPISDEIEGPVIEEESTDIEATTTEAVSTTTEEISTTTTTTVDFVSSISVSTTTITEISEEDPIATTTITELPAEESDFIATTTTTIVSEATTTATTIPPITEEVSAEETPVIDESLVTEETPVDETLVIEQTPATEEQPVIAPADNNFGEQTPPADNSSSGGDSGGGETVSAAPSDGVTE